MTEKNDVVLAHAELGASTSERWMMCPGSVRLSRGMPDPQTSYQLEGNVAHKLAEMALAKETDTDVYVGTEILGVTVDDDMADAVQVYVAHVAAQRKAAGAGARLLLEHRFTLSNLNPPAPMFGTADAVVLAPALRTLYVNDLKYGRGTVVEVEDNTQLLYYALGALLEVEKSPMYRGAFDRVVVTIVQPRAPHEQGAVRSVTYDYLDVVAFAGELMERARAVLRPDAPLVTGSWCRFCRAAAVCPARAEEALELLQTEFAPDQPPEPETLPVEVLSDILRRAPVLEEWLASARSYMASIVERDGPTAGWKTVAKRPVRRWVAADITLDWANRHNVNTADLMTAPELRSVAQVEKFLKKIGVTLPADLYVKESSGTTLVPESDPRPAAVSGAAQEFAALADSSPQRGASAKG